MVDHLKKSVLYSCAGALLLSALLFVPSCGKKDSGAETRSQAASEIETVVNVYNAGDV